MKLGIISDVHGNATGLRRALDILHDADEIMCLGDCITQYKFCNASIDLLRQRNALVVLGNHDVGYLKHLGGQPSQKRAAQPELVAWLGNQPEQREVTLLNKKLVMVHSTPWTHDYVRPGSPAMKRFADVDADIVFVGHTHVPFVDRIGSVLVVNPGAAGQHHHSPLNPECNFTCITLDLESGDAELVKYDENTGLARQSIGPTSGMRSMPGNIEA